jgi:predicted AAA+ superfamily ATPase
MWIRRSVEPHTVSVARHFPAVLLTGARQTGKTSLLRHAYPKAELLSLDLPSLARQAEESPEALLAAHAGPVILDEIQYAPSLFRYLKVVIDRDRHAVGRFLMTGSQKLPLMRAVSESLAGRCAVLELETLSSAEILGARLRTPSVTELLWRGGFPELWRDRDLPAREFFASYVATYLERDVRSLLRTSSLRDFERFLRGCATRSGQLLNLTDLARDVGIAATTARDWIAVLAASSQLVLLEPWFGNVGKRMIKAPKLYLRDTGLLCFLLGIDSAATLERSSLLGAVWETFVLGQILRAKATSGSAAGVFFWRDAHGTEVDFVLERDGRIRLIEAKWTETGVPDRALAPLFKVATLLGARAEDEHWLACRVRLPHTLAGHPTVRLIDAARFDDWVGAPVEPRRTPSARHEARDSGKPRGA